MKCERQTANGDCLRCSATARAVNPEFNAKYTPAKHASGMTSASTLTCVPNTGFNPLSAKNTAAPHQNASAGALPLNNSLRTLVLVFLALRLATYDMTRLSTAI